MSPAFEIVADPQRNLLRMALSGFFQPEDVARFAERKRAAHAELRCSPNTHVTLVDVSACKIQTQTVVGAFAALIADPRYRARRTAFVTGSSLATMQVRRLINGAADMRLYADPVLAEAWLLASQVKAA
jgi:hypothetical protein